MKVKELIKELESVLKTEGDIEVDISCDKQPLVDSTQNYLVSTPEFVIVEKYDEGETRVCLRDWPY